MGPLTACLVHDEGNENTSPAGRMGKQTVVLLLNRAEELNHNLVHTHQHVVLGLFCSAAVLLLILTIFMAHNQATAAPLFVSLISHFKSLLYPGGLLLFYDVLQDVILKPPSVPLPKHANVYMNIDI